MRNDLDCATILAVLEGRPGKYVVISAAEREARTGEVRRGTWHDEFFRSSQIDEIPRYLDELVQKCDLYIAPRRFDRLDRCAGSEADTSLAYADLDERDPRQLPPGFRPHLALETSPGRYQAVWLCDGLVSDELNQRLTYSIGADRGGWAANKLLRLIPGSINHKYAEKPRVRLLWDERASRPPLAVSELRKLPAARERRPHGTCSASFASRPDATRDELIRMLPRGAGTLRYNLNRMRPRLGEDRSRVTCRHIRELIEFGASDDEVFVMIEPCGFNHWTGDPEGLRGDIARLRAKEQRR